MYLMRPFLYIKLMLMILQPIFAVRGDYGKIPNWCGTQETTSVCGLLAVCKEPYACIRNKINLSNLGCANNGRGGGDLNWVIVKSYGTRWGMFPALGSFQNEVI